MNRPPTVMPGARGPPSSVGYHPTGARPIVGSLVRPVTAGGAGGSGGYMQAPRPYASTMGPRGPVSNMMGVPRPSYGSYHQPVPKAYNFKKDNSTSLEYEPYMIDIKYVTRCAEACSLRDFRWVVVLDTCSRCKSLDACVLSCVQVHRFKFEDSVWWHGHGPRACRRTAADKERRPSN